jgi:hypothetical protein
MLSTAAVDDGVAATLGDGVAADGVPSEPPPQAASTAVRARDRIIANGLTGSDRGMAILLPPSVTRLRCTSQVFPCRMIPHRRLPEEMTNLAWWT